MSNKDTPITQEIPRVLGTLGVGRLGRRREEQIYFLFYNEKETTGQILILNHQFHVLYQFHYLKQILKTRDHNCLTYIEQS